jgi:transcription elongation GreA/GreB family factor
MNMIRDYLLTPGGLERLRERIAAARAAYRAVCDGNPEALEAGDNSGWHDNFAYEENQRQMHQLARRVHDLEAALRQVVLVPLRATPSETVEIGMYVEYQLEDDEPRRCWLAGCDDGDPEHGRLGCTTPLGKALLGARAGDVRETRIGGRPREVTVITIGPAVTAEEDRGAERKPSSGEAMCAAG